MALNVKKHITKTQITDKQYFIYLNIFFFIYNQG